MNLAEIKERFEKVAGQEWVYAPERHCQDSQVRCSFGYKPDNVTLILASYEQHSNGNGEFIGHAKDDIGFLISKIERMQKMILKSVMLDYIKKPFSELSTKGAYSVIVDPVEMQAFFDVEVKNE